MAVLPQPAKAIIVGRGERLKAVASCVKVNPDLFGRVLNRRTASWLALRRRLSEYLGLPESELFDEPVSSDEMSEQVGALLERTLAGRPRAITDPGALAAVARNLGLIVANRGTK